MSAQEPHSSLLPPALFITVVLCFLFAVAASLGFFTVCNDFWGIVALARHFSLSSLSTWYHPFYPFGYVAALKLAAGDGYPASGATFFNIALSALIFAALLHAAGRFSLPLSAGCLSAIFAALFPRLFHYLCSAGPEVGAIAFFSAGAALLLGSGADRGNRPRAGPADIIAGALFGLGGWFRFEAWYAATIFLACRYLLCDRSLKTLMTAMAGLAAVSWPQWLITAWFGRSAGPSPLSYFLFNLMYGIDWFHAKSLVVPASALSLIADDPALFIRRYLHHALRILPFTAVPSLSALCVSWLLLRSGRPAANDRTCGPLAKLSLFFRSVRCWCAFVIGYGLLASLGASSRATLVPLPLSLLFFSASLFLLFSAWCRSRARAAAVIVAAAVGIAACAAKDVQKFLYWKNASKEYAAIEQSAMAHGAASSLEVFATDFDLFFTRLKPYRPLYNGGWLKLPLSRGAGSAADLDLGSTDSFLADCRARNVRFLCLTKEAGRAAPFLGEVFEGTGDDSRFALIRETTGYKLLLLAPLPPGRQ